MINPLTFKIHISKRNLTFRKGEDEHSMRESTRIEQFNSYKEHLQLNKSIEKWGKRKTNNTDDFVPLAKTLKNSV